MISVSARRSALQNARFYGILDLGYVAADAVLPMAEKMIQAGVEIVQLRAKTLSAQAFLELAKPLAPLFQAAAIPFILNDHPALVQTVGADGAHVGQDDLSVAEARALAGPDALIGKSTHSLAQASAGWQEADYIGFGPLFATPTKPDYAAIGLGHILEVETRSSIPAFCIGGIKQANLAQVLAAGARRVVIVSEFLQASDPVKYGREILSLLPHSSA